MVGSSHNEDEHTASSSIFYHAKYNDPDAELVIETSDKVHFRVHTYHMRSWR